MNLSDIYAIESEVEASEVEYYQCLQRAINDGAAWSFQGSYGRAMMEAIENGLCALGTSSARDYYGNYIPSRHEVKEGTKGSLQFVEQHHGQDWLQLIENV